MSVTGTILITGAAKAALESLMRSVAEQLAADGVAVNAVVPGYVRKAFEADADAVTVASRRPGLARVPMQRIGEPDEIAAAIEFLLSPVRRTSRARHCTWTVASRCSARASRRHDR